MTNNLTVYSASAGSGKTFTLAAHYIAIVLANPEDYRHTLAVTFTNKATVEMKERILKYLYDLSCGIAATDPNFVTKVKELLDESGRKLTDKEIQRNAKTVLIAIVHHYGLMHIETIDSFFQKVLRGLAREMGLSNNLRIELNDEAIEKEAVDHLLDGANDDAYSILLDWIKERMNEGNSWDYRKDLEGFGKEIFKTDYKQIADKIGNMSADDFDDLKNRLFKEKEEVAKQQKALIEDIKNRDMDGGKRFQEWLVKMEGIADKMPLEISKTAEKYLTTDDINKIEKLAVRMNSAKFTLKHLNELMLLKTVDEKVRQMNKEADRFLLSDTQHLLGKMIGENDDAPFIYEKMGTWLKHIMIDEFQDTGLNQWQNFKVLLKDCMSQNDSRNLIVGDVKQSIYRWRDGDWRILSDLHGKHLTENTRGLQAQIESKSLATNFRSCPVIVDWNNRVFSRLKDTIAKYLKESVNDANIKRLQEAYSDDNTRQETSRKEGGCVSVTFYSKNKENKKDATEFVCEWTRNVLEQLSKEGKTDWSDTAILVRKNEQAQMLANYLKEKMPEVHAVSNEAFLLSSAWSIKVIIALLRCMAQPLERLWNETARHLLGVEKLDLPKEQKSLTETVEYLIQDYLPQDNHQEDLYLMTFMDTVREWAKKTRVATVRGFLETWDGNNTLNLGGKGVVITTIHKSKGLEYDRIIMPFIGMGKDIDLNNTLLWAKPNRNETPYDMLPAIPVKGAEALGQSIFSDSLYEEQFLAHVDLLNTLYVGFTRAKKNLFLLAKNDGVKSKNAGDFLYEAIQSMKDDASEWNLDNLNEEMQDGFVFEMLRWGTVDTETKVTNKDKNKDLPFGMVSEEELVEFVSSDISNLKFRQSNKSKEFVEQTRADDERNWRSYLEHGTLLHKAMESVKTSDDLQRLNDIFNIMAKEGLMNESETEQKTEELQNLLNVSFDKYPIIQEWFGEGMRLFNERDIIFRDTHGQLQVKRPDRVVYDPDKNVMTVVDYKFGENQITEHEKQVREYMTLLRNMGYTSVKGYLWYVTNNEIKEVL